MIFRIVCALFLKGCGLNGRKLDRCLSGDVEII